MARIVRRGKQLALIARDGRALAVSLGMTGRLLYHRGSGWDGFDHVHAAWRLSRASGERNRSYEHRWLLYHDPRRFGELAPFPSIDETRRKRWSALGPDALAIGPAALHAALKATRRPIKATLLDQSLIAGLGNIYADEALFRTALAPRRITCTLRPAETRRLAEAIRKTLTAAIHAGGSTFRDYLDPLGGAGGYLATGAVYGRSGRPCPRCDLALIRDQVAQRTTVWCRRCQY